MLKTTPDGPRLAWTPVAEIESLRGKSHQLRDLAIKAGVAQPLAELKGDLLDLTIDVEPKAATELGLRVRGLEIRYDVKRQTLSCGDRTAPIPLTEGKVRLRLLIDRTSVEIFAGGGLVYMPMAAVPKKSDPAGIELFAVGGDAVARSVEAHELTSIWPGVPAK
jgi:sucrose-6-phosphate hydrolase SacC (GH32 family)